MKENVFDQALNRIRWLFDEFEQVVVSYSWWKDSQIILELALIVAEERNVDLPVIFIDQEAERWTTIEMVEKTMSRKRVVPYRFQVPFKIENWASFDSPYLHVRDPEKEWERIRPKVDISIKENVYDFERWTWNMFANIFNHHFGDKKHANLWGMRIEESPNRQLALTSDLTYKRVTRWSRNWEPKDSNHYTFHPIYDWSYLDVWKAIHDNWRDYNKLYDYQYRYWIKVRAMRVSSLHHETALAQLFYLPEVDMDLYNRLTKRLSGISTANNLKEDLKMKKLPFMFSSWGEYRDYLLEHLVSEEYQQAFRNFFWQHKKYTDEIWDQEVTDKVNKKEVQCILVNDYAWSKHRSIIRWLWIERRVHRWTLEKR